MDTREKKAKDRAVASRHYKLEYATVAGVWFPESGIYSYIELTGMIGREKLIVTRRGNWYLMEGKERKIKYLTPTQKDMMLRMLGLAV